MSEPPSTGEEPLRSGPSLRRRSASTERTDSPLDFAELRREGIALAQRFSGERWTDYNLHDPGVTLLEQLCFALTDVSYRAGAPVAEFLSDPSGDINFERCALHGPSAVLPCRPTTCEDYRKVLLDAIPEIDAIWITPERGGLYRIAVALAEGIGEVDDALRNRLRRTVREVYARHRNLCEDLADVTIVGERHCTLEANLEVSGERPAEDLVAELYFRCARHVAAGSQLSTYHERQRAGESIEELFTGPLTEHGYVEASPQDTQADRVYPADLMAIASHVQGVRRAGQVLLRRQGQVEASSVPRRDPQDGSALRLCLSLDHVRLSKGGRAIPVDVLAVRAAYERRVFDERARRHAREDLDSLHSAPVGRARAFADYTSVQNELPANYQVGARGVPLAKANTEQVLAWQLRGYLAMFDQVLANFGTQMAHVRDLYAVDGAAQQSYWMQPLTEASVAGIAQLQCEDDPAGPLERTRRQFDPALDRRSRLLDYLLALHGQRFTQRSLRYFGEREEPGTTQGGPYAQGKQRVINKAQLLRDIVRLNRDRGGASDDVHAGRNRDGTRGRPCALASRLCTLLEIDATDLTVVEHIALREQDDGPAQIDALAHRLSVLLPQALLMRREEGFRALAEETIRINCPAHIWPAVHWLDAGTHGQLHAMLSEATARAARAPWLRELLTRSGR